MNADNPIARELHGQAKPEIEAGHFKRAHELLRQATQGQIAATQQAYKLQKKAHAAAEAQMKGRSRPSSGARCALAGVAGLHTNAVVSEPGRYP